MIRILGGYVRQEFLKWLAWRSFAFTLVAQAVVTPLIGLAVWSAAAPGKRMLDYFLVLMIVRLLTSSYEDHTFSERIYIGWFADDLLRPHPPVLAPLGENLAMRIWHVIIGLPLVALIAVIAPPAVRWQDAMLAVPALVLAAALRFLLTYTLSLSAFWTERAHSAVGLGNTLIFLAGGEAAPIFLMPSGLRPWAQVLPFRSMLGFPAEVATGSLSGTDVAFGYLLQLLWLVLLVRASRSVWRAGIRRYTVVGG
ncbi:MAG TPA: ABC-2 family transporter protein [Symbiobacteriaceae bacterium]|nr:ABC-2 family transporter protein [Symbiobacteriaceae bacterium]